MTRMTAPTDGHQDVADHRHEPEERVEPKPNPAGAQTKGIVQEMGEGFNLLLFDSYRCHAFILPQFGVC